jgi:glycosyltransferase involved in cell wall biosynthesis
MDSKTAKLPKLTFLSDSPFIPTGYRNQSLLLAKYLVEKGYDLDFLANAYNGITIKHAVLDDGTELNFKIHGEMTQSYFANSMSQHLKETNSDIFWILLDTFMLFSANFLNIDTSPSKTIFWFPSDGGGGMPKNCENILRKVNRPVAMSKFGQKQVKDYYGIDVDYIPHGTEPNRFYRLPDEQRDELRKKWGFHDKFVIGVVARNQPRKNLDRTIKVMSLLKEKIPNAVLFLHMDPNDPANPMFQIANLITKFNVENRVIFSGMKAHKGLGWDKMNDIYNLMDCFLLTTSGEGFGIPIIEAMSCEVPVLATDYTTTPELVIENNAGLGIQLSGVETIDMFKTDSKEYDKLVFDGTMTGSWEVERGFCSVTDAVTKLEYIYKNPQIARQMGINGRKAVLTKYDFNKIIAPKWEKLMTELWQST